MMPMLPNDAVIVIGTSFFDKSVNKIPIAHGTRIYHAPSSVICYDKLYCLE